MRTSLLWVLLFSSVAVAVGCKRGESAAGDAGQATAPGQTPLPLPIMGAPGTGSATVPDDFPKVVPVYPGAKVVAATKTAGTANKGAWSLGLQTPDDKNRVFTFFRANLSTFREMTDNTVGATRTGTWQNPQYDVTVTVGEAPGNGTAIMMAVGAK